jgi:MerR family transcriptional regulator, light-induced transcriptional regulator
MNPSKDTPIYNLKAVVQETHIKPDTLRAWERRYHIPKPQRTASGHRLYSQNDIDMLHWLLARQEEGLSISRAIEMWQHMQPDDSQELGTNGHHDNDGAALAHPSIAVAHPIAPSASGEGTLAQFTDQWVKACINFDQPLADQILSQAFALFPVETVCTRLIQVGLAQIGDGWLRGTVTVQQEHFASSIAIRRMETMLTATPDATRNARILVGNPPGEEHTFVPLMLSLLLRRRGWDVIYLGANVPIGSLDSTLDSVKPNLVILTAQQIYSAATLLEMSEVFLQARTPLAFGGLVFTQVPEMVKLIPGYYLGEKLEDAVRIVEQIMASLRVKLAQRTISQEYRDAYLHFQERRAQVEATLWNQTMQIGISQRDLGIANQELGDAIGAALQLGNIQFVESTIHWIESTLINHHRVRADVVDLYFEAYALALQKNLGANGHLIRQWFALLYGIETTNGAAKAPSTTKRRTP